jgi:uncharacterized protein (DUF983 family)
VGAIPIIRLAMPNKMNCPVCGSDMRGKSLLFPQRLKSIRVCPDCHAKYTTDASTKRRGRVVAVFAILTLILSVAGLLIGFPWGILAFILGTGLLIYVGYAASKMTYIEYRD